MTLGDDVVPRFPRGVRLHHDQQRNAWILLAPERIFKLDDIAVAILKRVDGTRSIGSIVDGLAQEFGAERQVIDKDVKALLMEISDRRLLDL